MTKYIFPSLFITLLLCFLTAQSDTPPSSSTDTIYVRSFHDQPFSLLPIQYTDIDSSLTAIQRYNPINSGRNFYRSQGNPGQSAQNMFFSPKFSNGWDFGIHSYDLYRYTPENIAYYDLSSPFSELNYVTGPKKEQSFNASFDSKLKHGFYIGAATQIVNAPGSYQRQLTDAPRMVLKLGYQTPNKRYGLYANYIFNRFSTWENGGIRFDTLFTQNIETDRQRITVFLDKAENQYRENSYYLRQYFNILPANKTLNAGTISHSIHLNKTSLNYNDQSTINTTDPNLTPLYTHYFKPNERKYSTFDTTFIYQLNNAFIWSNASTTDSTNKNPFLFNLGVKNKHLEYSHKWDTDTLVLLEGEYSKKTFNQWIFQAGFSQTVFTNWTLRARGQFIQGDYNQGDYNIEGTLEKTALLWKHPLKISVFAKQFQQMPGYFLQNYYSNNFQWSNNFKQEFYLITGGSLQYRGSYINFNQIVSSNYTFINESFTPEQADKTFTIFQLAAGKNFRFKHIGIDIHTILQQTTGDNNFLHLPKAAIKTAIYYHQSLFKNALQLEPGINFETNAAYKTDNYIPSLGTYAVQNKIKNDGYLKIDAYVSFRVKRARFFLSYEHANKGLMKYTYFNRVRYPMHDGGFHFGINWRFFN